MGKYLDSDYNEVEAFSKDELEAEIEKATKKAEADFKKQVEAKEAELNSKTSEYEKLSKKYDSRKDEYENLKKKFEETGEKLTSTQEEKKTTYQKLVEDTIKKASGDDKEYAETFKEKYEKFYGNEDALTLDPSVIQERAKEIHSIVVTSLDRDFTPFNMASGSTGEAPRINTGGEQRFTETSAGKDTLDYVLTSMGQAPSQVNSNDKK